MAGVTVWAYGVGLSLIHLVVTLMVTLVVFGQKVAALQTGQSASPAHDMLVGTKRVLLEPMSSAYPLIPDAQQTNLTEWTLFVTNSLLWGFIPLLLFWSWRHLRKRDTESALAEDGV
ncbi:MAG: hypothetical protein AB7G75_21795 [Candidatus Binatia bacterium]